MNLEIQADVEIKARSSKRRQKPRNTRRVVEKVMQTKQSTGLNNSTKQLKKSHAI